MESDILCLDATILDIHLVADQYDGDVFAHTHEIAMPVLHVLVGNTRGDIEHKDGALPLNVVTITESTELLLSSLEDTQNAARGVR